MGLSTRLLNRILNMNPSELSDNPARAPRYSSLEIDSNNTSYCNMVAITRHLLYELQKMLIN